MYKKPEPSPRGYNQINMYASPFVVGNQVEYIAANPRLGIKRGFSFTITAVHKSGHWVKDEYNRDHAIWHLRIKQTKRY